MSRSETSLAVAGLLTLAGLGSLALLGPHELSGPLLVAIAGFLLAMAVSTRAILRAGSHGAGSAALWFGIVPVSLGLLWAGTSWLQALTAAWWSTRVALGAQLLAVVAWGLVALVAERAARVARDEEVDREATDIIRNDEDAFDRRLASALRLRVAMREERPLAVEPHSEGIRAPVDSVTIAPTEASPNMDLVSRPAGSPHLS